MTLQSQQSRDILYETKKSLLSRNEFEQPPSTLFENPKKEIDELRNQLRRRETDIIRLKTRVSELEHELKSAQSVSKVSHTLAMDESKKNSEDMGRVNFIADNKALKDECEDLRNEVFALNGIKNDLERALRQSRAEVENNGRKLRQLQIIEKMRQERFEDELTIAKDALAKMEPPIEQDKEFREAARVAIDFLREGLCQAIFDIFINSANQSEQRKTTSLIVFRSSLNELRKSRRNCVLLSCRTYLQFKKVVKLYCVDYGQAQIDTNQQPRNNLNTWLCNSIVEVTKGSKGNLLEELEMRLFRLLALYYRVKYPLKGEKNLQIDQDLRVQLEGLICQALLTVLVA